MKKNFHTANLANAFRLSKDKKEFSFCPSITRLDALNLKQKHES